MERRKAGVRIDAVSAGPFPGASRVRISCTSSPAIVGAGAQSDGPPRLNVQSLSWKGGMPEFLPAQSTQPAMVIVLGFCTCRRSNQFTANPMKNPSTAPASAATTIAATTAIAPPADAGDASSLEESREPESVPPRRRPSRGRASRRHRFAGAVVLGAATGHLSPPGDRDGDAADGTPPCRRSR